MGTRYLKLCDAIIATSVEPRCSQRGLISNPFAAYLLHNVFISIIYSPVIATTVCPQSCLLTISMTLSHRVLRALSLLKHYQNRHLKRSMYVALLSFFSRADRRVVGLRSNNGRQATEGKCSACANILDRLPSLLRLRYLR